MLAYFFMSSSRKNERSNERKYNSSSFWSILFTSSIYKYYWLSRNYY